MCVVWGIPYLLIRVAVREVTPATLVFLRCAAASAFLLPLAAARHELAPVLRRWRPLLAFAAAEVALPWLALSSAERRVSSSLAALLVAAVPFVGVAIAAATRSRERLDRVRAASLGTCAVAYAPVAALQLPRRLPGSHALLSIAALAVICTALAFVLFFELIAEVGPVRATVITYVNPAVAAVLGVAVLHERLTAGMGAGFVLVLAGSVLATRAERQALVAEP